MPSKSNSPTSPEMIADRPPTESVTLARPEEGRRLPTAAETEIFFGSPSHSNHSVEAVGARRPETELQLARVAEYPPVRGCGRQEQEAGEQGRGKNAGAPEDAIHGALLSAEAQDACARWNRSWRRSGNWACRRRRRPN